MASNSTTQKFSTTSEGNITPANTITVGAVLPILGMIAVTARFYGKKNVSVVFLGADDWLILVSLIFTIGMGVMMIVGGAMHGLAQPTSQGTGPKGFLSATDNALILTEKIFWSFDLLQCLGFGTAKLSVIFFYRRIFRGTIFDIISIGMAVIICIWTAGFFFAILFRCGIQFWALWAPLKYLLANCYASTPMFQAFCISDVITDVIILAIPIYWTMQLRMTLGRRIAVCGVFLLGGVVIGAGIARLVIFIRQTNNPYLNADGIGHLTTEIWWSMIEMGISIVAACLPTIRPLFGNSFPEQAINSIRSIFSLHSLTSISSSARRRAAGPGDDINERTKYTQFSEDQASMEQGHRKPSGESGKMSRKIPLRDLEAQKNVPNANKILVSSRIEQDIKTIGDGQD
ncbi:hypothetical protein G7Y89_g13692 [Cudoniella acicularis]|uniref:Rhodopsin domain-containing protein n=1 Tax=Cudoniella acicularis TaxID=354080 RepID=A0A8H4VVT8_9HELO|nr:hypothetical protein G7Y89_g13692 [Cudoniella acicularis]